MSVVQTLLASHRTGDNVGLYSVCCSNEQVLLAAMQVAVHHDTPLLVEATSNQVDQFGGYTGMNPAQFRDYVLQLARAFDIACGVACGILGHAGAGRYRQ